MHAEQLRLSRGFPEVRPRRVVPSQPKIAPKIEPRGQNRQIGRCFQVVEALADAHRLFQQDVSDADVRQLGHFLTRKQIRRNRHVGLYHDVGAESGNHAVGLGGVLDAHDRLLRALAVQNGL